MSSYGRHSHLLAKLEREKQQDISTSLKMGEKSGARRVEEGMPGQLQSGGPCTGTGRTLW
jgi:hypothetical protein